MFSCYFYENFKKNLFKEQLPVSASESDFY